MLVILRSVPTDENRRYRPALQGGTLTSLGRARPKKENGGAKKSLVMKLAEWRGEDLDSEDEEDLIENEAPTATQKAAPIDPG